MRNVEFKLVGNVFLSVFGERNATDAEAAEGTEILRKAVDRNCKILVVTRGGANTAQQRKRVYEVLGGRQPRAAIVSESKLVRGVVTAMSWFNKETQAFALEDLEYAFEYLDIAPSQYDMLRKEIETLDAKLPKR